MAIPTHYSITHSCGHKQEHDLSKKPAGKRKGFANWLSGNICSRCYRKEGAEEFKAKLLEEALSNQEKLGLPALEGTEKQVAWATTSRNELLMKAFEELVRGPEATHTEEQFEAEYLVPARHITYASWWIDYQDTEIDDLKECLETAVDDPNQVINENPY
ncbi:hypothetical protein ACN08Y_07945 [Rothia sp. P5764]|uniref:hypothetical protein n=1 Tax=Rothia sp. P5764 TaxID=3402654 RepID=UPI003AC8EF62